MRAVRRRATEVLSSLDDGVKLRLAVLVGASDVGVRLALEGSLRQARPTLVEAGVVDQRGRLSRLGRVVAKQAGAGIVVDDRARVDAYIEHALRGSFDGDGDG